MKGLQFMYPQWMEMSNVYEPAFRFNSSLDTTNRPCQGKCSEVTMWVSDSSEALTVTSMRTTFSFGGLNNSSYQRSRCMFILFTHLIIAVLWWAPLDAEHYHDLWQAKFLLQRTGRTGFISVENSIHSTTFHQAHSNTAYSSIL